MHSFVVHSDFTLTFFLMQKKYSILCALGIAVASLSSCSRANYAFQSTAPAYLGVEQAHSVAIEPTTAEATEATTVVTGSAAASMHEAAPTRHAHRAATRSAAAHIAAKADVAATPTVAPTKAERKTVREFVKKALLAPQKNQADGKSQLAALLLAIFLGTLGIARFYLGYTGRGILMLVLTILVIPFIVSFILNIIDIIRIATGSLKPQDGDYGKKL